ncbi:Os02g0518950, partial [Oryza sativa Japonica Group]
YHFVTSRLPPGQARLHLIAFIGHRLPSQTNTGLFCTLCPHSCAPGKNFPVGYPSQITPGQARLTLEFFGHWLPEKKL